MISGGGEQKIINLLNEIWRQYLTVLGKPNQIKFFVSAYFGWYSFLTNKSVVMENLFRN